MNEAGRADFAPTAGELLRAAREERGVRIETLASTLKVSVRKLEDLEADRHHDLPDPAFVRALSLSVCRILGADATPVMAQLPPARGWSEGLEHVAAGLDTSFNARSQGRHRWAAKFTRRGLLLLAVGLAVLAALWLWLLGPVRTGPGAATGSQAVTALAASGAAGQSPTAAGADKSPTVVAALDGVSGSQHAGPPAAHADTAGSSAVAGASVEPAVGGLPAPPSGTSSKPVGPAAASSVNVTAASRIELRDGRGVLLWARTLRAGEAVALEGRLPLRLVTNNAAATRIVFAGRKIDLKPWTRDNVASVKLN